MNTYAFLVLALGGWARSENADCVTTRTESGLVCGARKVASNGDKFISFLGIPYAKAPIGELRFAEPQKPLPFTGIFNATVPGAICPQHATKMVAAFMKPHSMDEDCLHVNVHAPVASLPDLEATGETKPLIPVLAFVHGGSFADGSGDPDLYGPEYLMTTGIIVVTLNYRVNVPGFLSLHSKKIPGNAGLRDVLFALKWIQRNIKNFGGDPKQVTLGGVSAGSAVAHLVAISPAVKGLGLFKGVILMSGTALANFFTISPLKVQYIAKLFLEGMGINPLQSQEKIYQQIINAPIEAILDANQYIRNKTSTKVGFEPVIEIPRKGFTTMIPKDPEILIKEGYGNEVPTLFGFSSSECSAYKHRIDRMQRKLRKLPLLSIPQNLLLTSNILTIPILTDMISREYFNGSLSTTSKYLRLCTDAFYKYPVLRTVEKRLEYDAEPSFVYEFKYEFEKNENPLKKIQDLNWTGVGHTEDLSYTFRVNSRNPPLKNDELALNTTSSKIKRFMVTSVSNFAKFGHPGATLSDWPETNYDFEYMSVEAPTPRFVPSSPEMQEMLQFFNKIYRIGHLTFTD